MVKVGSGQRHKSRQKALGAEEKWLRAHQRHLAEVREEHDVIFYGDDLIEAWRCAPDPAPSACNALEWFVMRGPSASRKYFGLLCELLAACSLARHLMSRMQLENFFFSFFYLKR